MLTQQLQRASQLAVTAAVLGTLCIVFSMPGQPACKPQALHSERLKPGRLAAVLCGFL